jgi:predicted acetyltransferase
MRFAVGACPIAGITFVGTRPVFRRKGHLRSIVSRHFQLMHEQGTQPVAALHASRTAIYRRYGYAVVAWRNSYQIDPRDLIFAKKSQEIDGILALREIDSDEFDVLKEVYRQFCKDRIGYLHRSGGFWDNGVLAPARRDGVLFQIICEQDEKVQGYVVYTVEPVRAKHNRLAQKVVIRDMAWLTPEAYRKIWGHFASMDLAESIQWMYVPADDPLAYLVSEPSALNIETRDGFMARIVDVAAAIPLRPYGADGRICFEIKDDMCPWNQGIWQMEISEGRAQIEPSEATPELCIPIDTMAMMVFGHLSPSKAVRMGLAEFHLPEALPLWDHIMQTPNLPFCPDFFDGVTVFRRGPVGDGAPGPCGPV